MKLKDITDNLTATILAVLLHVVLFGVLLLSYDWSSSGAPSSSQVVPVQAVVIDESQVAEEIEQIKRREERKRRQEEKRTRVLERDAQKAREQRRAEEKRLGELQRRLAEEKRKHDDSARRQREEAAEALAEVKRQRAEEVEALKKLKRAESELGKRRLADEAALAVLAEQHKALTDEKRKIEAAKLRAQAERERVEEQTRKATEARQAEQKLLNAALRGITINDLRVEVEGDLDLAGFFGLSDEVPPGFINVRAVVHLDADATPEQLQALHEHTLKTSPVGSILTQPLNVTTELATSRVPA